MRTKNEICVPSPAIPVTSKGAEARQRIIAAAESLFSLRGFDQVTVAQIARAAVAGLEKSESGAVRHATLAIPSQHP